MNREMRKLHTSFKTKRGKGGGETRKSQFGERYRQSAYVRTRQGEKKRTTKGQTMSYIKKEKDRGPRRGLTKKCKRLQGKKTHFPTLKKRRGERTPENSDSRFL